ncbi:MAG: hypothetical protein VW891_18230, partial [Novosphingobium sp.]
CFHTPIDRKSGLRGSAPLRIPFKALRPFERLELVTILSAAMEYKTQAHKLALSIPEMRDAIAANSGSRGPGSSAGAGGAGAGGAGQRTSRQKLSVDSKANGNEGMAMISAETEANLEARINEVERRALATSDRITDADLVARDTVTHTLLRKHFVAYKPHSSFFRLVSCVRPETAAAALKHDGEPRTLTKNHKELVNGPHYRLFPLESKEMKARMEARMRAVYSKQEAGSSHGLSRASVVRSNSEKVLYDKFQGNSRNDVRAGQKNQKRDRSGEHLDGLKRQGNGSGSWSGAGSSGGQGGGANGQSGSHGPP